MIEGGEIRIEDIDNMVNVHFFSSCLVPSNFEKGLNQMNIIDRVQGLDRVHEFKSQIKLAKSKFLDLIYIWT